MIYIFEHTEISIQNIYWMNYDDTKCTQQYPAYADFAFEHNMVGEVGYRLAKKGNTSPHPLSVCTFTPQHWRVASN